MTDVDTSRKLYLKLKYNLYQKLRIAAQKENVGISKFIIGILEKEVSHIEIQDKQKTI